MWHQQNKTQSNLCCLCLFALLSCFPSTCTNCTEAISSIMTKVEMKKISICKSENFWPFSNKKHFCYMRGQIQSKRLLIERTCNLLVNYRTVNWFRLNSSRKWKEITFANGKKFLHLQMDIFCHFDFVIIEEMPSVCRIFFACWTFWHTLIESISQDLGTLFVDHKKRAS